MSNLGSQIQTSVHVRLATAAALPTCTYADASGVLPTSTLGAKLTASSAAALTVDGVAVAVDDEVLVKDQAATLQNGVYRVRNAGSTTAVWMLERSRQARDSSQFNGMLVTTGPEGTANPSVTFLYSGGSAPVIGTDAITYANSAAAPAVAALSNLYANPTLVTLDHTAGGSFTAGLGVPAVIFVTSDNAGTIATTTIGSTAGDLTAGWELVVTFIVASTVVAHSAIFSETDALALPTEATAGQSFRYIWDDAAGKFKKLA